MCSGYAGKTWFAERLTGMTDGNNGTDRRKIPKREVEFPFFRQVFLVNLDKIEKITCVSEDIM
jgi:hypothetical protein